MEDIKFQKVSESESFEKFRPLLELGTKKVNSKMDAARACSGVSQLSTERKENFLEALRMEPAPKPVLLRYLSHDGVDTQTDDEDAGASVFYRSHDTTPDPPVLKSRFDDQRPRPIQYPECLRDLLDDINKLTGIPSEEEVAVWCEQLEKSLIVSAAERSTVCTTTKQQASSHLWYKERICRLTASNVGLIRKRRAANMKSLVIQLLYKEPPVAVHAMRLGRSNEGLVVQKYKALKEAAEELVEVFETGLHIHPTVGILAASLDRLVNDSSCNPSNGLLEVKYPASVEGPPENAIHGKSNYCLEQSEAGRVQLKRSHNYYYQASTRADGLHRQDVV